MFRTYSFFGELFQIWAVFRRTRKPGGFHGFSRTRKTSGTAGFLRQKRSKSTGESRVRVFFIIFYDFSWCGSTCEIANKCLFSLRNLGDFQTHSKTGWFSRVLTHPKKCRARVFFSGGGRLPEPRAAQNTGFVRHSFGVAREVRGANF